MNLADVVKKQLVDVGARQADEPEIRENVPLSRDTSGNAGRPLHSTRSQGSGISTARLLTG